MERSAETLDKSLEDLAGSLFELSAHNVTMAASRINP